MKMTRTPESIGLFGGSEIDRPFDYFTQHF